MSLFKVELSVVEGGRKKLGHTIDTDLEGEITLQELLEWTKQSLIIVADQALTTEQKLGFDKEPIMLVDGKRNVGIETVSPLGRIEFVARQEFSGILRATYERLIKLSPVDTGRYVSSHYVFLNGIQVATDLSSFDRWMATKPSMEEKDVVRIVNIQPYGRRLELLGISSKNRKHRSRDKNRGRKDTKVIVSIPNGAYQLTIRAIKSKFKENTYMRFEFIPGNLLGLAGKFKGAVGRNGKKISKKSIGRAYLYPSIVFKLSSRGLI